MPTKKKSGLPLKAGAKANKQTLTVLLLGLIAVGGYVIYQTFAATSVPIAFIDEQSPNPSGLQTIRADGTGLQMLTTLIAADSPRYSPDRANIALLEYTDPTYATTQLTIVSLATKQKRVLPVTGKVLTANWLTNSKLIYLSEINNSAKLYTLDTSNNSSTLVTTLSTWSEGSNPVRLEHLTASLDGTRAFLTRQQNNGQGWNSTILSISTAPGSTAIELFSSAVGNYCGYPKPIPKQAGYVSYSCNSGSGTATTSHLYKQPAAGGAKSAIYSSATGYSLGDHVWAPSGSSIAFLVGNFNFPNDQAQSTIVITDASGRKPKTIATSPLYSGGRGGSSLYEHVGMAWAPDSSAIAYKGVDNPGLTRYTVRGGKSQVLLPTVSTIAW